LSQLPRLGGLGEVGVKPGLAGARLVLRPAVAGQGDQQDGRVRPLAQPAGDVPAVGPRQADVQHHDVRAESPHHLQRRRAVAGQADLVAPHPQEQRHALPVVPVVVDGQHAQGHVPHLGFL
jgi:hypothetical protein